MTWRKSTYSTDQANCVEVRHLRDAVAIRDSKNPDGPVLVVPAVDWRRLVR
ncbi:DUF397 domain-containing protein [Actinosynnema sp. NPDC047251]|uniref:DUF397 domain-containing protein n=1 Tax=Saccharothrix espanaensis (strain ATCC 51144 / DSM 44229 / JCM 9112 / NBRC 15066 / NRRL 15764) TaxID=1179773 RepID=K0KBL4_SACES|nr:DUF397 domain-containing protein [Saccharothrix espanaensis]CCH34937.1 hypothetical protein BN6_77170 [Saccharothrix espanaensis DSM 44229]